MPGARSSQQISVAIIGRSHANEFRALLRQIQNSPDLLISEQFETIEEAVTAGLGECLPADIAVVLQAFSDEYSAADASQLIGRMLFRRVLCCYGPWCLADGRTHEVWPVVARVSVASAWKILQQEVRDIRAGVAAMLPMVAAEEVFSHRGIADSDRDPAGVGAVLIVSDDRPFRATLADMLRHTAIQVFQCGSSMGRPELTLDLLKVTDSVRSETKVLLDIDGVEHHELTLLQVIRSKFPMSELIRLTSFPHAVAGNDRYNQVVDKLEISTWLFC